MILHQLKHRLLVPLWPLPLSLSHPFYTKLGASGITDNTVQYNTIQLIQGLNSQWGNGRMEVLKDGWKDGRASGNTPLSPTATYQGP